MSEVHVNPEETTTSTNDAMHPTDASTSSPGQEILHNVQRDTDASTITSDHSISFRPLQEGDRDQIQELHEEWFPVRYKSEFYDELVCHRMVNSGELLFTCAAIYHEQDSRIKAENLEYCRQVGANDDLNSDEDYIAGCIVGSFVSVNRLNQETAGLLVSDEWQFTKLFYIMTVGVIAEFRHRELGSTLVKKVISLVEGDQSCGAIYLHVITHNSAAIQFYEKLGFVRVTEIQDYYSIDGENHNCYLYARYFNGNKGQRALYHLASRYLCIAWKRLTETSSFLGIRLDRSQQERSNLITISDEHPVNTLYS